MKNKLERIERCTEQRQEQIREDREVYRTEARTNKRGQRDA